MHPILDSTFGSIFNWFFFPTWAPRSWKIEPRYSQSTIFEKSPFQVNIDFWFHFGANLLLFWHPKSTNIRPKIDPKRYWKNDWFLDRFFGHLGSILGANLELKLPKERPGERRGETSLRKKRPEMPPRGPLIPFWCQLGTILAPRRSIFWRSWLILGAKFRLKLLIKRPGKRRPTERYGEWPEMPSRDFRVDFQTAQKCFFNRPRWQKLSGNLRRTNLRMTRGIISQWYSPN